MNALADKIRERLAEYRRDFLSGIEAQQQALRGKLGESREIPPLHLLWIKAQHFIRAYKIDAAITSPFIYSLIIPIAMLDLFMTVYQHVCFRVYRIPRVCRGDYIVMDRAKLAYLSPLQKVDCIYCEYANGVLGYAHEI